MAAHVPPLAVGMRRAFNSAAIARRGAPCSRMGRMIGMTLVANAFGTQSALTRQPPRERQKVATGAVIGRRAGAEHAAFGTHDRPMFATGLNSLGVEPRLAANREAITLLSGHHFLHQYHSRSPWTSCRTLRSPDRGEVLPEPKLKLSVVAISLQSIVYQIVSLSQSAR